jgi:hypothetical protein
MYALQRFFGGPPLMVLLRLALLSLVVGIVLSVLGLHPFDIWHGIRGFAARVYAMGFDALEWTLDYFLLGALIVVPIWLLMRVLKFFGGRSS